MASAGIAQPEEESSRLPRILAGVALLCAVLLVLALILFSGSSYKVTAEFDNAGQLVRGNDVRVGGAKVGTVQEIDVSQSGLAEVTFEIEDEDYVPLRRGTEAVVKLGSLSGIANRYIDLQLGPDSGDDIADGGRIGHDDTRAAVELDQVFAIFDERTRRGLQDVVAGSAQSLAGRGEELRRGIHYLNPALSTGARLFGELSRDDRLLSRFLVDSSDLVTALGQRRRELRGAVEGLGTTFTALGGQQEALGDAVGRLPPFLRRANTTFVDLRSALDDVDPLVDAAKPVARRLGPFLSQARLFAADAEPTVRDLSRTIRSPGDANDLIEAFRSFPPLARSALDAVRVNGALRRGALPETTAALRAAAPTIALGRPYTPEFVGWMDDFSTTGAYDALGEYSRAWVNLSEILYGPGPKLGQFRRCPGANEEPAPDGSNVLSASEQARLGCTDAHRSVGP
ncbi:MAG: MCE family protein [Thermoleophilaceae bacterium]|nr:MCE family protein [Thermoleophilaceae bacterium]